jgi:peptidoglycan biosynthesis protein MviN/MurJ (putative lipid II flippase)
VRWIPRPRVDTTEIWRSFLPKLGMVVLGMGIVSLGNSVLDQLMVVQVGPKANAVIGYSNRLTALVLSLGALAVARVMLPVLSGYAAQDRAQQARMAYSWTAIMFGLGAIGVMIAWPLAPFGVSILFKRGAFTAQDVTMVSDVLRLSLLQVPFYFANLVLVQLVASRGMYRYFLITSVVQLVVKFGLNLLLIPALGERGAALATAIRTAEALAFVIGYLMIVKAKPSKDEAAAPPV